MSEQQQPNQEAWVEEIIRKTQMIDQQAEMITDNLCLSSTLILGVVQLNRKVQSRIIGFDGSLLELVQAAREFIADFDSGAFTSDGSSQNPNENGEGEDE